MIKVLTFQILQKYDKESTFLAIACENPVKTILPYHKLTTVGCQKVDKIWYKYNSLHTMWIQSAAVRYIQLLCRDWGNHRLIFPRLWAPGLFGLVCPFHPLRIAVLLRWREDCFREHATTKRSVFVIFQTNFWGGFGLGEHSLQINR